jgi:hypothetical protein
MKSRISSVLYEESRTLLSDFQDRAPVDSGVFRNNWRLLRSRFTSSNTLASYTLSNATPYAIFMEEGAEKNKSPWNFPGKRKRTGKLAVRKGRVWAGGLNPGHSKTVHGAIGPVLVNNNRRLNQLTNKIADAVIGGFK